MARKKYTIEHGGGSFYQRADGIWVGAIQAGWSETGARRRITVSSRDKDKAWDKLTAARRSLALTGEVGKTSITVKSWVDQWLTIGKATDKPQTLQQYASRLRRWVVPQIGHKRISAVTPGDVRDIHAAMREAGRSETTMKHVHSTLINCLHAAIPEGYKVPASVLAMKAPSAADNDRDAIPLDDALALVKIVGGEPDSSRWIAALLQGMRQGECLGLTWDAVDFEREIIDVTAQLVQLPYADRTAGTFEIPRGYVVRHLIGSYHLAEPKSKSARRVIPMIGWMKTALKQWRAASPESPLGLVWPRLGGRFDGQGRPRQPVADRDAWYGILDRAQVWKVPGVRSGDGEGWETEPVRYKLHEARHTTASLLLAAGVEPELIRIILGHSKISMSRTYMHAETERIRAALAASAAQLQLPG